MKGSLQWGGRFSSAPDAVLLAYGSSLAEDAVLAPFDVQCSRAHVLALRGGAILSERCAQELLDALDAVAAEIVEGSFQEYAAACGAEDVHGAIDARVREIAPGAGASLHAGRSRNDQVATTLLLYCADRAARCAAQSLAIADWFVDRAEEELAQKTLLGGMTHWQPAQPVLLAFWLAAAAEPFVRDARRFAAVRADALRSCPLGSGALAGSSLPLDRAAAARALGFDAPSRNALDAVGNRDAALDAAHACARVVLNASRICEELVLWCAPAFGFAHLGDAAATGSSLMPQKRNPDPFELVRGVAAELCGRYGGALASTKGVALSYHRDLQIVKRGVIGIVETALVSLEAFQGALRHLQFGRERMNAGANDGYAVATDVAEAMILSGASAREAHAAVGAQVAAHERGGAAPAWPDARASVAGKRTAGSTNPAQLECSLADVRAEIARLRT